jgi:G6PDH family F420-dependent oxidoreductase
MVKIGYTLSSEEFDPNQLVRFAQRAEDAGFEFALISDHYHPWLEKQGHSPFVWCVIGGVAKTTSRLRLGTGVTCPLIRIHPAIIAQAAATAAIMMEGRFFLGLGAGENLNEHILGDKWPEPRTRLAMLEEAIDVIQLLWQGETQSHSGRFYTVDQARVFTLPDEPPPIAVAVGGSKVAKLAGQRADAMIGVEPKATLVNEFEAAGGKKKPRYGQITVCWAKTEKAGRHTLHEHWANTGIPGDISWELKTVELFEAACKLVRPDDLSKVACGPDPEPYLEVIGKYADAGYDHVYLHQIGPQQEEFIQFCEDQIMPNVAKSGARRKRA